MDGCFRNWKFVGIDSLVNLSTCLTPALRTARQFITVGTANPDAWQDSNRLPGLATPAARTLHPVPVPSIFSGPSSFFIVFPQNLSSDPPSQHHPSYIFTSPLPRYIYIAYTLSQQLLSQERDWWISARLCFNSNLLFPALLVRIQNRSQYCIFGLSSMIQ